MQEPTLCERSFSFLFPAAKWQFYLSKAPLHRLQGQHGVNKQRLCFQYNRLEEKFAPAFLVSKCVEIELFAQGFAEPTSDATLSE